MVPQFEQQEAEGLGECDKKVLIAAPHLLPEVRAAAMQRDGETRGRESCMQAFIIDVVAAASRVRQGLFDGNVVNAHLAQRLFGYPAITQVNESSLPAADRDEAFINQLPPVLRVVVDLLIGLMI